MASVITINEQLNKTEAAILRTAARKTHTNLSIGLQLKTIKFTLVNIFSDNYNENPLKHKQFTCTPSASQKHNSSHCLGRVSQMIQKSLKNTQN